LDWYLAYKSNSVVDIQPRGKSGSLQSHATSFDSYLKRPEQQPELPGPAGGLLALAGCRLLAVTTAFLPQPSRLVVIRRSPLEFVAIAIPDRALMASARRR
jgi:hypothetical protein